MITEQKYKLNSYNDLFGVSDRDEQPVKIFYFIAFSDYQGEYASALRNFRVWRTFILISGQPTSIVEWYSMRTYS